MITIERTTAAEAWAATFERVLSNGGVAVNAITSWTSDIENGEIEATLDSFILSRPKPGWPVLTVANTIFPVDLYDPDLGLEALEQFCEWYLIGLEVSRSASPGGEYCERLVAWEGPDGQVVNQLTDVASKLRRYSDPGSTGYNYSSNYELGVEHPVLDLRAQMPGKNTDPYGFPCLSHISLTAVDGAVHLTALYRNQHLVSKAYGNYMGLTRLCSALCHHANLTFGSVTVVATHASAEVGGKGFGKVVLGALSSEVAAQTGGVTVSVLQDLRRRLIQQVGGITHPEGTSFGVDLVSVASFSADFGTDDELLEVAFTPEELAECSGDMERLAAKFATKEAFVKAIGTGFRGVDPTDVTIRSAANGRPSVHLNGRATEAARLAGFNHFECTNAHEEGVAVALVAASRSVGGK